MVAGRKTPRGTRNPELIRGVQMYSRSKMYHKRGLWAIKAKNGGSFPKHDPKPAPAKPAEKSPKFYPADDVKKPIPNRRKPKPTKLKASITPGTVLILLAGPFKVNGVPLRRVCQSYVIGTSTEVDISGVDVEKFDDAYFSKKAKKKCEKTEGEFFGEEKGKAGISQEKKDDQKLVDAPLLKAIESVECLKEYLGARFSLRDGDYPHNLKF